MTLNVEIAGRMAIPVRAIPCVVGVNLFPPNFVAEMLSQQSEATTIFRENLSKLIAHRLDANGLRDVLPKEWDAVVDNIQALTDRFQLEGKGKGAGDFALWCKHALMCLPGDCFVWQDEFEEAFRKDYKDGPAPRGLANERPGDRDLVYSPLSLPMPENVFTDGLANAQKIGERASKGRYTLDQAAELLEKQGGERKNAILRKLCDAAREGDLPVYAPGRTTRYEYGPGKDAVRVRPCHEEVYWEDLNNWLRQNEPRCEFAFNKPLVPNGDIQSDVKKKQPQGSKSWQESARDIADELQARDTALGTHSSLGDMGCRVAKEMRKRDIQGPMGPLAGATVKREALQGGRWTRRRGGNQPGEPGEIGES